jgi:hypothetical protein
VARTQNEQIDSCSMRSYRADKDAVETFVLRMNFGVARWRER